MIADVAPSFSSEYGRLCPQCMSDDIKIWDEKTCPKCGCKMIDEGDTPASKVGMQGRYHLLKYEDWDYKSLYNIFDYNSTLIGKPKHITVEKDGIIQSFYFENRIGSTIEIKYIDAADKAAIIEKYEKQKYNNFLRGLGL